MRQLLSNLSFSRIGVIYVWILIIVAFSIAEPELFPREATATAILNNYAIAGLAALAVLMPMASGAFDASIGGNISFSSVVCAYLFVSTELSVPVIVALTLGVGLLIGLANVVVVVLLRIPSLIGTLAMWMIAAALSVAVSGNTTIASPRIGGDFSTYFSRSTILGVTVMVAFVVVVMAILGVLLTQTTIGRYTYAVGFDPEVSRLAGIRVRSIQALSLVIAGVLGSFTGLVLTAKVASSAPAIGDSYLLPAFAAVFLGATQFKAKRFNAVGTVLAVFMLGTGQYGLVLAGAPSWAPNVFQGAALIAAIGVTQIGGTGLARRRNRSEDEPAQPLTPAERPPPEPVTAP